MGIYDEARLALTEDRGGEVSLTLFFCSFPEDDTGLPK